MIHTSDPRFHAQTGDIRTERMILDAAHGKRFQECTLEELEVCRRNFNRSRKHARTADLLMRLDAQLSAIRFELKRRQVQTPPAA